jgi:hypothetical protein
MEMLRGTRKRGGEETDGSVNSGCLSCPCDPLIRVKVLAQKQEHDGIKR